MSIIKYKITVHVQYKMNCCIIQLYIPSWLFFSKSVSSSDEASISVEDLESSIFSFWLIFRRNWRFLYIKQEHTVAPIANTANPINVGYSHMNELSLQLVGLNASVK